MSDNPYYSIVELTEQFEKLSTDQLKAIDTRVVCKLLLACAQQLSVISGRLADIKESMESANVARAIAGAVGKKAK